MLEDIVAEGAICRVCDLIIAVYRGMHAIRAVSVDVACGVGFSRHKDRAKEDGKTKRDAKDQKQSFFVFMIFILLLVY